MENLSVILLTKEKPSEYFEELRRTGGLLPEFAELAALVNVPQNLSYHREGDVWVHTMLVLDEAAKRRDIAKNPLGFMLSALCHDYGKAVCTEEVGGVIHAYGHETEGIPIAADFLRKIGADEPLTAYVLNMVKLHMQPNVAANNRSRLKVTNKLFDSAVEPFDLIQLAICDGLGKIPQSASGEDFLLERYSAFCEIMARPYVTADDIAALGYEPAAELMEYAHKLRLAGIDRESALRQCAAYAGKVLKQKG